MRERSGAAGCPVLLLTARAPRASAARARSAPIDQAFFALGDNILD